MNLFKKKDSSDDDDDDGDDDGEGDIELELELEEIPGPKPQPTKASLWWLVVFALAFYVQAMELVVVWLNSDTYVSAMLAEMTFSSRIVLLVLTASLWLLILPLHPRTPVVYENSYLQALSEWLVVVYALRVTWLAALVGLIGFQCYVDTTPQHDGFVWTYIGAAILFFFLCCLREGIWAPSVPLVGALLLFLLWWFHVFGAWAEFIGVAAILTCWTWRIQVNLSL